MSEREKGNIKITFMHGHWDFINQLININKLSKLKLKYERWVNIITTTKKQAKTSTLYNNHLIIRANIRRKYFLIIFQKLFLSIFSTHSQLLYTLVLFIRKNQSTKYTKHQDNFIQLNPYLLLLSSSTLLVFLCSFTYTQQRS